MIKHAPIRRRTLILDDARHLGQQYSYSWIMNVEHSDKSWKWSWGKGNLSTSKSQITKWWATYSASP